MQIIAELGSNHQGDLSTALKLIEESAKAGATAVKLQKRSNRHLYTKAFYDSAYNSENAYGPTYGEHREALEFGKYEHRLLRVAAEDAGLKYYCTAFDFESVDLLLEVGVHGLKFASGSITNTPLLEYGARTGLPMYVSSGACHLEDVQRAVDAVLKWTHTFTLLHCTAVYPCPAELLDLGVIANYRHRFPGLTIGFSSHYSGIWPCTVAYVLGARVFESHLTLNRAMRGTDHAFSLEPQGLGKMVRDLRRLEGALGVEKVFHEEEIPAQAKMGGTLYAARALPANYEITHADIAIKSPAGVGLAPYRLQDVIGARTVRNLESDEPITEQDLDGVAELLQPDLGGSEAVGL